MSIYMRHNELAESMLQRMQATITHEVTDGMAALAAWFANREVRVSEIEQKELVNSQAPAFAALSVWCSLRAAIADWPTETLDMKQWNKIFEPHGLQFVTRAGMGNWSIYRGIEGFIHGHSTPYRLTDSNEWGWRTHDIKMTARNWIEQVMKDYRERVLEYHLPKEVYCLLHDEAGYRKMLEPVAVDCYEQLDKYPRVVTIAYVHGFACEAERVLELYGYNMRATRTPKGF